MNQFLETYKNLGFTNVEGWCSDLLFDTIDILNNAAINKAGGALEIGIHHGKLYLLLNQVVDEDQSSYAVDVFDNQNLNIDKSGRGSLERFKFNLAKYDKHQGQNTQLIIGDSTDCALNLKGISRLRFISIDGGHTVAHTLNDLKLAEGLVHNEGVVILDDILNYHWLGVIEGVGRYLDTHPTLVPFAVGHNKLYLCKISFQNFYISLFLNSQLISKKEVPFYGHKIPALINARK